MYHDQVSLCQRTYIRYRCQKYLYRFASKKRDRCSGSTVGFETKWLPEHTNDRFLGVFPSLSLITSTPRLETRARKKHMATVHSMLHQKTNKDLPAIRIHMNRVRNCRKQKFGTSDQFWMPEDLYTQVGSAQPLGTADGTAMPCLFPLSCGLLLIAVAWDGTDGAIACL